MPSRRSVLRTCGVSVALGAGCSGRRESSTETSTVRTPTVDVSSEPPPVTTGAAETTTPASAGTRPAASVYFSEIRPNPTGDDGENPNDEYVLLEVNTGEQRDLSDYSLAYGDAHQYAFPDVVSAVGAGASIVVRSGRGENRVEGTEYPTYSLFVGSATPLLDDGGMRLTLRDGVGEPVDRVTYPALDRGAIWVRPSDSVLARLGVGTRTSGVSTTTDDGPAIYVPFREATVPPSHATYRR